MKAIFWAFILVLTASVSFAGDIQPTVEPLMGFSTGFYGVRVQVNSGGCTYKSSFEVQTENVGDIAKVTFYRIESDPCLALYFYGLTLEYSYQELGLQKDQKFVIANPISWSIVR